MAKGTLRFNNMAEVEALKNRTIDRGKALSYNPVGQNPPNKFHAVICEADGIKFRSKKERRRYLELKVLQKCGECWFLRQVPFYLPGDTKYLLDFLVFWKDGHQTFEDTKGKRTPMYIMKKKQVEALYPVKILEN